MYIVHQMNQDTEKWPVFNPNAKQSLYATVRTKPASSPVSSTTDLFMEEMSGMVTLKKKPKDKEKGTIMDSSLLSRQGSIGSGAGSGGAGPNKAQDPVQLNTPVRSPSAANLT